MTTLDEKPKKWIYIGAPASFELELACRHLEDAFPSYGVYVVGSVLERPDWRDVDLRMIIEDDEFYALFPDCVREQPGAWEFDARWLLLTTAISQWLSKQTGLPIDFQFQPQGHANEKHNKKRNAVGMRLVSPRDSEQPPEGEGAEK